MNNKKKVHEKKLDRMFSLDQLLPSAGGSIFGLARIAMMRALEVYDGSRPLVDTLPLDKSTTIAFREIAAGKIVVGKGRSAEKSQEAAESDAD